MSHQILPRSVKNESAPQHETLIKWPIEATQRAWSLRQILPCEFEVPILVFADVKPSEQIGRGKPSARETGKTGFHLVAVKCDGKIIPMGIRAYDCHGHHRCDLPAALIF